MGIGLAVGHGLEKNMVVDGVLIALASIVGLALVANMYTWGQALMALVFSQRRRVIRSAEHIDDLKMDGFMQHLKREVWVVFFKNLFVYVLFRSLKEEEEN